MLRHSSVCEDIGGTMASIPKEKVVAKVAGNEYLQQNGDPGDDLILRQVYGGDSGTP